MKREKQARDVLVEEGMRRSVWCTACQRRITRRHRQVMHAYRDSGLPFCVESYHASHDPRSQPRV